MTEAINFWKYEATGNDFVMLDDSATAETMHPATVRWLCDRKRGVGADGVIRVVSEGETFRMEYRNADGSVAETCGNGLRCIGAFLHDRGLLEGSEALVVTGGGTRVVRLDGPGSDSIAVEMGVPELDARKIPLVGAIEDSFVGRPFDLGNGDWAQATAVSMGNPHLVLFVGRPLGEVDVSGIGARLQEHPWFPEGVNVEFVRLDAPGFQVRVWERGSGETAACGSGACAVAVAGIEAGVATSRVLLRFPGGDLEVERRPGGDVVLRGPAWRVFEGVVPAASR